MMESAEDSPRSLLLSLSYKYSPLYVSVCEWLEGDQQVPVNASSCTNQTERSRLPSDVCRVLQNLSAPLNGTLCLAPAPKLEDSDVIRGACLATLALMSFLGNCYTIYSIRSTESPAPVYKLILHLSMADVLVSVVCILGEAVWTLVVQWTFGNAACKVFKFLQMLALHGSSYVVVLIAQDRLLAVSHPLISRRSSFCSSTRSVFFVWIVGAVLSTPQLVVFNVQRGPFFEDYYQCVTYSTVNPEHERMINILYFVTLFVVPLFVLVGSYLSLYCVISKSQKEIRSIDKISIAAHDQNRQRSMKRALVKSRWISVVIVCAYLIFWLPYYISMFVFFLTGQQEVSEPDWMRWIFFFGMGNSAVNPVIYGMFQLWRPKRRKRGSCFRHRDGSTQLTQLTGQDSFRRHAALQALHLPPGPAGSAGFPHVSPVGSVPASPVPVPLSSIPDVRRGPVAPLPSPTIAATAVTITETTLMLGETLTPRIMEAGERDRARPSIRTVALKSGGWRTKFLRKYRDLRGHTPPSQAHNI